MIRRRWAVINIRNDQQVKLVGRFWWRSSAEGHVRFLNRHLSPDADHDLRVVPASSLDQPGRRT